MRQDVLMITPHFQSSEPAHVLGRFFSFEAKGVQQQFGKIANPAMVLGSAGDQGARQG